MIRRTVYCVEPYRGKAGRLAADFVQEFSCETAARRFGRTLRAIVPAMVIYMREVEPEYGARGDVTVLDRYGRVPCRCD